MYLVITGTIPLPWEKNAYIHLTDLYGNDIYIPTTTVFSLAFSLFSMIKAIVYFNIARIHVGVSNIVHSRIFSIMKKKIYKLFSCIRLDFSYQNYRRLSIRHECGNLLYQHLTILRYSYPLQFFERLRLSSYLFTCLGVSLSVGQHSFWQT